MGLRRQRAVDAALVEQFEDRLGRTVRRPHPQLPVNFQEFGLQTLLGGVVGELLQQRLTQCRPIDLFLQELGHQGFAVSRLGCEK